MSSPSEAVDVTRLVGGVLPTPDALLRTVHEQHLRLEEQQLEVARQGQIVAKKSEVIAHQKATIAVLEEQLRLARRQRFGASSETNVLQGDLLGDEAETLADGAPDPDDGKCDDEDATGTSEEPDKAPRKRPGRKGLSPELPRVRREIRLSDAERAGALDTFFVKVKEELDIEPSRAQVIEHWQEKAVRLDEDGERTLVAATRPPHPLGKAICSANLLAWLIVAKYADGRVPRARGSKGLGIVRNFANDEGLAPRGRLAGAGLKPLQAAGVKSPGGERCRKRCGSGRIRWERERRTQVNRRCRVKTYPDDAETGRCPFVRDEGRGEPVECSTGIWHEGGVTLDQALARNEGTCRPDAKGAAQAENIREGQSTDAGHRGGDVRSRVEGSVMGLDRRGIVVQSDVGHNRGSG